MLAFRGACLVTKRALAVGLMVSQRNMADADRRQARRAKRRIQWTLHGAGPAGMMERSPIRATIRLIRIREISMLGRILAMTLTVGALMTSSAALAQRDPVAGAVAGAIEGAAIASGLVVPYEQREPLRTYVYREPRPVYRYEDESYPVPEQYGVPEHHYAIVNGRAVIFHPQTRRIIHVYD
jgi:hypothetical protein